MPPLPGRVMVDLPNWLGDFVHTWPALARLRDANLGGETWALLPAGHAPLARLLGLAAIERPRDAALSFGRRLRGRFDAVLSARHSSRAKLLLRGTAAPLALASRGRGAALLGLTTFAVVRSRHQRHDLDLALRVMGLPAVDGEPFAVRLPERLAARGRRERGRLAGGAPAVALLPATRGGNGKQYPAERFRAVAAGLAAEGAAPVVVVGPGEAELGARVAGAAAGPLAPADLALDEVAALLAACDACVGNDSGLTHLAAAVGCPTVALFGPTDPARTAPAAGAVVLEAAAGLGGLAPGLVVATIAAILDSRRDEALRANRAGALAARPPRRRTRACVQSRATV